MTSHLLSLSALHTAAPGILDVVFGPDGDFDGAPKWTGPVVGPAVHQHIVFDSVVEHADDGLLLFHGEDIQPWTDGDPLDWFALDLRIPSVASRLAGLCARALAGRAFTAGRISRSQYGIWYLMVYADGMSGSYLWDAEGSADRSHSFNGGASMPTLSAGLVDDASFLSALTLALAPRIAALGGPNG